MTEFDQYIRNSRTHLDSRLAEIRNELVQIANQEVKSMRRLYWRAKEHNCSEELLKKIREEQRWCERAVIYPDALMCHSTEYELKYAFNMYNEDHNQMTEEQYESAYLDWYECKRDNNDYSEYDY